MQRAGRQQHRVGPEFAAILGANADQSLGPVGVGDEIANRLPGQHGEVGQMLNPLQQGVLAVGLQVLDRGEGVEVGGFLGMFDDAGVQRQCQGPGIPAGAVAGQLADDGLQIRFRLEAMDAQQGFGLLVVGQPIPDR